MKYKFYSNMDKMDKALEKRNAADQRIQDQKEAETVLNVGGMKFSTADLLRLVAAGAPIAGGLIGGGIGLATGGLPAAAVGGSMGSGGGALIATGANMLADKTEEDRLEEEAKLAERDAYVLNTTARWG